MFEIMYVLILNFYISAADVAATLGGTVNLTCNVGGSIFGWHKKDNGDKWSLLLDKGKYEGSDRTNLTIKNVDTNDAGVYRCFSFHNHTRFPEHGSNITLKLPVNGHFEEWREWDDCSVTCGGGQRSRHRICNNPPPSGGGSNCSGATQQTDNCSNNKCSVNGHFEEWREWGGCSVTCGGGQRFRHRICNNNPPSGGGSSCSGDTQQQDNCSNNKCPEWTTWQSWISCSVNCGYGTRSRNRNCQQCSPCGSVDVKHCSGVSNETEKCSVIPCSGIPQVSISHQSHFVQIGTTVTFVCNIHSNPPVTDLWWTDNQSQVITDTQRYSGGNKLSPNLRITSVKDSDSGVYTCNANNTEGTSSATTTLITGNITQATILQEYYVATKGQDIVLECLIKTEPSNKDLYWLKGSTILKPNRMGKYSGGTLSEPSLTLKKVDKNDAEYYTCKLENEFKNSEDVVELKVLSVYVYDPGNLYIRANETVTLQCNATGGNSVAWRRDDKIIDTTSSVEYSGGTLDTPSLTISNVTRYHSGNYTCETSYNLVKVTSEKAIQLYVKDTPLIYQSSDNIQASTGDYIQLQCVHKSYPKPSVVFWKKDGEKLNVSNSKYNGSTINEPSLTIFKTVQLDSGMYVCGVVNDIGTGYSSKILLIIKDQEKTGEGLVPIVGGGIGAIVVFFAVFIICILLRRRRNSNQKDTNGRKVNTKLITDEQAVHYRPEPAEDEASTSILIKSIKPTDGERNNRNMNHGSIKVNELKDYISKRHMNEVLEDEYKKIPYGNLHSTTKAQQKENLQKNRFKTTFPYDHTRVVLEPGHGKSSDYINANYIDGFKKEKCYIASQGPLKNTINDHWRMIWQNNTRKIIMLTNLVEGTNRKCERYWPDGGKPITYGNLVLTLLTEKERAAYITREIEVDNKKTKEKRCITQYHFTAWPDHGTPDPLYLVLFHKHVIADHTSTENNGPLLVHCSAGIGRTGTYIGLDALYEEGRDTGFVDIVKFVQKMRYSRMNMVQTSGQYVCLHYALLEAFTMKDTNVGKKEFRTIWKDILEDNGPVNRQRLHEEFEMLEVKKSDQEKAQYVAATSPENVEKNRNENIIPSDNSRLFLSSYDKGRTDYINAVQAPSYTKFVGYLTTQLPLPDTKVDFWTMVGDHNSSTIVVFLNDPAEADLVYSTSKDSFTCGKYSLEIKRRKQEDLDVTSCKVVLSKKGAQSRDIDVYLAVVKGIPDPQVLCKLVNRISTRVSMSNDPVTVVSGDGAKNCGVFCTFANGVSSMNIDKNANIFQLTRLLQLRRPEFFADFEEYRLCYEALNVYLESSNVYENF